MSTQDVVSLARDLLRFDTVNPPGQERDCAHMAGSLLEEWGFAVEFFEYEKDRTSVIVRAGGSDVKAPLCLTGHLDVVPLGTRAWSKDPFKGETDGDRLYGRGSSDMKAGLAAMLLAAKSFAKIWTQPDDEWVRRVFEICRPILGEAPEPRTAPYMTDAANLLKVYAGAPTLVLGPGEAAMAHQTDEYCHMERIGQAVAKR